VQQVPETASARRWTTAAKVWVAVLALAVVSLTGALVAVSFQLRETSEDSSYQQQVDQASERSFELEKACIESGGQWVDMPLASQSYCDR
jgi:hypothetical protein